MFCLYSIASQGLGGSPWPRAFSGQATGLSEFQNGSGAAINSTGASVMTSYSSLALDITIVVAALTRATPRRIAGAFAARPLAFQWGWESSPCVSMLVGVTWESRGIGGHSRCSVLA